MICVHVYRSTIFVSQLFELMVSPIPSSDLIEPIHSLIEAYSTSLFSLHRVHTSSSKRLKLPLVTCEFRYQPSLSNHLCSYNTSHNRSKVAFHRVYEAIRPDRETKIIVPTNWSLNPRLPNPQL